MASFVARLGSNIRIETSVDDAEKVPGNDFVMEAMNNGATSIVIKSTDGSVVTTGRKVGNVNAVCTHDSNKVLQCKGKGHTAKYQSNVGGMYAGGWGCDAGCLGSFDDSAGRFNCPTCQLDICIDCMKNADPARVEGISD